MGDKGGLSAVIKARNQGAQQGQHLLAIAGIAGIHKEVHPLVPQDTDITAAGRFNEGDMEIISNRIFGDPGVKSASAVSSKCFRKTTNVVKGLMEWLVTLIQHLHNEIGVDD